MPEGAVDLRSVHSSRRKATREGQPKASQGGLDRFGRAGKVGCWLAAGQGAGREGPLAAQGVWLGPPYRVADGFVQPIFRCEA